MIFNFFYYRNKTKSCDGKKRDEECFIIPLSTDLTSSELESFFFIKRFTGSD